MNRSAPFAAVHAILALAGLFAGAVLATSATRAQTAMPPVRDIGDTCFARSYTAAHMAGHRLQKIRRIVLTTVERRGQKPVLPKGKFEMLLGVQQRQSSQWFYSFAECSFRKGGYACGLESDGGSFAVTDRTDGNVRISTTGSLRMEGAQGSIEFGGDYSDDNIFLLRPAACRTK